MVAQRDLRRTLARHLQFSAKSMRTSCSDTSTSLSIERETECVFPRDIQNALPVKTRDSVGP